MDGQNCCLTGHVSMSVTGQRIDTHCVPGILVIGVDGYNKSITKDVAPTISGSASDFQHTHGAILVQGPQTACRPKITMLQTNDNTSTRPQLTLLPPHERTSP